MIIGSGYLTDEETKKSSEIVKRAGTFLLKQSLKKTPWKEKARHLKIMKKAAPGPLIKASAQIRTLKDLKMMVRAGADIIGTRSGVKKMNRKKFENLVNEGIMAIPKRFLEKLDNVDIVIEDEPTTYQLRKLQVKGELILFGLYEGVPQTKRGHYGQVLPDKITIFRKPIEKLARDEKEIREIVKNTVWHEIAHHFGMDERRVREAEYRKKKLK